jgi:hypothetical protein
MRTTRFNVQNCHLPTQRICVFCVDLRTNTDYLLYSINLLVFITETECLLRGTFCPHSVFMCFVWIWEQTPIIYCTALTDWFL